MAFCSAIFPKPEGGLMQKALLMIIVMGALSICSGRAFPYQLDWTVDGPVTASCAALCVSGLLAGSDDGGEPWNGETPESSDVNSFDRWAMNPYAAGSDHAGTALSLAAMAAPAALASADSGDWATIAVMYAESVLLTTGIKNTLKGLVERERPYMYFDDPCESELASGDYMHSFPSGHTAYAFNGAVFTSRVFSRCFPDSPWKTPVIAGSMGLASPPPFSGSRAETTSFRMCWPGPP